MRQETDNERNPSSPILPLVVAALAGATLAIACERPDSRASAPMPPASEAVALNAHPPSRPDITAAPSAAAPVVPPDVLTDTVISGRVNAALLTDPAMAGADVSVNTEHGVVSLTGTVKSHEQAGIASAHAQRQDGVMGVDSHISLNPQ